MSPGIVHVAPPSLVEVIGNEVFTMSPNATHDVVDGQTTERSELENPLGEENPLGGVSAVHVAPPSDVATMAGSEGSEVVVDPTAVHLLVEGQATASSDSPDDTDSDVQFVPPFVVPMTEVPLTAVQSEVDGHDTPPQGSDEHTCPSPAANPDGTAWSCQVAPPSVVPTIAEPPELVFPSASHTDIEAHEMAPREPVAAGRLCRVHVAPPSVVLTTTPEPKFCVLPVLPIPPTASPTAVHTVEVGHETATRSSTPSAATKSVAQFVPPFVVFTTAAALMLVHPAAIQSEVVEHDTALTALTGAVCVVHPDALVVEICPSPTEIHTDVEGQETLCTAVGSVPPVHTASKVQLPLSTMGSA